MPLCLEEYWGSALPEARALSAPHAGREDCFDLDAMAYGKPVRAGHGECITEEQAA